MTYTQIGNVYPALFLLGPYCRVVRDGKTTRPGARDQRPETRDQRPETRRVTRFVLVFSARACTALHNHYVRYAKIAQLPSADAAGRTPDWLAGL